MEHEMDTIPMWKQVALVALLSFVSACSSGGGDGGQSTTINGIAVPPDPGTTNNATVVGIDVNKNGVRDDVERAIAENYGTQPAVYNDVFQYARKIQATMVDQSEQTAQTQVDSLRCVSTENLTVFSKIERLMVNTNERATIYVSFAGISPFENIVCR